jgi:4'-phosphopantetheinyl transferase
MGGDDHERLRLDDSMGLAKHACMRTIAATDFVDALPPVTLAGDEIHVWLYREAQPGSSMPIVRELLAAYLNVDPDAVGIERDDRGKPYLARPAESALHFNLSHSGGYLAVALGLRHALGVDIEGSPRDRPWLALAQRYFAPDEYRLLSLLPPDRIPAAFLQLWSCKEAVVKALGFGIAFGLDRVAFDLDGDGCPRDLIGVADGTESGADWQIMQMRPVGGLVGALAWRGPEKRVRTFRMRAGRR